MAGLAAKLVPFDNTLRRWELNASFLPALDPHGDFRRVTRPRFPHLIQRKSRRRAAVMPFAPWAGKLWPRDRWERVIQALTEDGWEVLALCGPKQTAAAREQVGPGVRITECGSIESWAQEFNECAFVITLDSGPMHLADALDLPVIALFGQGKLPLWAPSGERSVVIAHRDADFFVCHPITANTALGQKYMNMITPAEVLTAVREVTAELPAHAPP
jgi:ADP-heptose:LPS heptosyltransferase